MGSERFYNIHPKGTITQLATKEEALAALANSKNGYIWFDFDDPDRSALMAYVEPLGLHPLAVEDCLDEEQIPKIDDFPNHTFILFNSYTYANKKLLIDEIDFFLGPNYLVTVHGHCAKDPAFFKKLEDFVKLEVSDIKKGPDFLLHVILDFIVDKKFLAIEGLQEEIEEIEERLLKDFLQFKAEELIFLRRHLLRLRKSLFHEREILVKVCRRDSPYIGEKTLYPFRDLYDHLTKFFEFVEINREMITNLMEVYLSMVNNNMSMTANQTNNQMKRLTVITTIFMPLTLLAGIGGMSEWSMMCGPENWKISYPFFCVAMLVIGGVNYAVLKWKKWI
ncbi:MAG: magnesium transporter CorA family protein [Candidatus Riflebacteria bacterium]|nr:magnesium transporter CorA family protein [Candidatus Riflebacteria bacterium]